jgi:outer membrane lipoprotein SlyB
MRNFSRLPALLTGAVMVSMLAACASPSVPMSSAYPNYPTSTYPNYPTSTYPTYPASAYPTAGTEYGRIVNIEYLQAGSSASSNRGILGAVVGGIAGAALGSTIGGGSGRTAATILGGVAGAAVGNSVARNNQPQGAPSHAGYRITMQSDQGITRTYDVPATGDLQVGDRVRIDGGVIYRS